MTNATLPPAAGERGWALAASLTAERSTNEAGVLVRVKSGAVSSLLCKNKLPGEINVALTTVIP